MNKPTPTPAASEYAAHTPEHQLVTFAAHNQVAPLALAQDCRDRSEAAAAQIAALRGALETAVLQLDYTVRSMSAGHTVSISSLQNCAAAARAALAGKGGAR